MTNRPTTFDAAVMAYKPGLHKLAKRFRHSKEDQADLVTDTIIYALGAWRNFRADPYERNNGMWSWLTFCMRGIVSNEAKKAEVRKGMRFVALTPAAETDRHTPPSQEHHVELLDTVNRCRIKGGNVVLRRAMGDTLADIGRRRGVSTTRVDQIASKARAKLKVAA
jgi:RNA polymerase sigma factor (sigma-70 family)